MNSYLIFSIVAINRIIISVYYSISFQSCWVCQMTKYIFSQNIIGTLFYLGSKDFVLYPVLFHWLSRFSDQLLVYMNMHISWNSLLQKLFSFMFFYVFNCVYYFLVTQVMINFIVLFFVMSFCVFLNKHLIYMYISKFLIRYTIFIYI